MKEDKLIVKLDKVSWTYSSRPRSQQTLKNTVISTLGRKGNYLQNKKAHLKEISLSLTAGQRVGIIGKNGSGKSTLLRVIAGILKPQSGVVEVSGKVTPLMDLGSTLISELSCYRNTILALCAMGWDRRKAYDKVDEIFMWAELEEFKEHPFFSLSAGMQSRLIFSIATSQDPDIILIDEILSTGDLNFKKKSSQKLETFVSSGSMLMVVSHDLQMLEEMTDEVVWIESGKIHKKGESSQILNEYRLEGGGSHS